METKKEEQFEKLSDVGLWIEDYEYIFSDFDSRPYSQKLLSEDLLSEMNRVVKDKKEGKFEIKFFVQKKERNLEKEKIIKKRIKEHFKNHLTHLKISQKKLFRQGILFIFLGILFMTFVTFFLTNQTSSYIITFLVVISEPAGWFLFWEGLNLLIFESKKRFPELKFYQKMTKTQVEFVGA